MSIMVIFHITLLEIYISISTGLKFHKYEHNRQPNNGVKFLLIWFPFEKKSLQF
jgi:hypothetical protein